MSDIDTTFALLVEGDPAPSGTMHPEAWDTTALLEEIRARRASMRTQSLDETPSHTPQRRSRRGLAIAAAAFAAVLVLIGVVALFGGEEPSDTTPPATSEVNPTAAAPTTAVPTTPPPTTGPSPTTATSTTGPSDTPAPPVLREAAYPLGPSFEVQTIALVPAELPGPLAYGSDGALYVGDWGSSGRIYRVLDGEVETWAESPLLNDASAAAFGPDGRLYVSGSGVDSDEAIVAVGEGGVVEVITEEVSQPTGVFFTPDGRLLVLDTGTIGRVVEVLADGSLDVIAEDAFLSEPTHMAVDDDGNLYVVNLRNGRLYLVGATGELTFVHRFEGAPVGMVYLDGALYVADWGESWIYRYVIEDGSVTTVAGYGPVGLEDGPGSSASLNSPDSLALGPDGEIYFVQLATEDGGVALRVLTPAD